MPYFLNTPADRQAMLAAIEVTSVEQLFEPIPAAARLNRPLDLPPALTELELTSHLQQLAGQNSYAGRQVCFLGGGAYDHFIPAVVDNLASRGEFYTSYTPYQAEASQGNLQVFFEYQTLVTQLTGMDVSNSSLYDGGSAAAEAVLMSINHTRRPKKVVVAASVHPEYRQVIETYLENFETKVVTVGTPNGVIRPEDLAAVVDADTACVLVQHPNFFGQVEQVQALGKIAHDHKALFVVAADPISLGLLQRPGDYGADIVIAEGQSLGNPLAYGGPYLGMMACSDELVRKMPGRLVGQTTDRHGQRCWVLTLQTREQHIRRDKASSNICTNQGLFALRSTIYMSAIGPQGLREVAELCVRKANYAATQLEQVGKLKRAFSGPIFKEFVMRVPTKDVTGWLAGLEQSGFLAGVPLAPWYPDLADCVLVAVTEKRSKAEIDRFAQAVGKQA